MKPITVLAISLSLLFLLAGCKEQTVDTSHIISSSDNSANSLSISTVSYEEIGVYGNGVRLLADTVCTVSGGMTDEHKEYAIEVNGVLYVPFAYRRMEIREEYGFLRILSDRGCGLLTPDGEEIFAIGEFDSLFPYEKWLTAERGDGSCVLYRNENGTLTEVLQSDSAYHYEVEYNGVAQFSGAEGTVLIAPDGSCTYTELSYEEELEQNGERLDSVANAFYRALLQCTPDNTDPIAPFLPEGVAETVRNAQPSQDAGSAELLAWLIQNRDGLTDSCATEEWQFLCTAAGGCSCNLLSFGLNGEVVECAFLLVSDGNGNFTVVSFEGQF